MSLLNSCRVFRNVDNLVKYIRMNFFLISVTIQPIDWLPTTPLDNETIVSVFGWGALTDGDFYFNLSTKLSILSLFKVDQYR